VAITEANKAKDQNADQNNTNQAPAREDHVRERLSMDEPRPTERENIFAAGRRSLDESRSSRAQVPQGKPAEENTMQRRSRSNSVDSASYEQEVQVEAVNLKDFLLWLEMLNPKDDIDKKILFAFRLYDTDNNGVLTYDNINHIIRASLVENDLKLGEEQIEQVVKNVFDKMDTNQDKTITYEEFKSAMLGYLGSKNVGEMTISKDNTKDANMNDLVERIDQRRASMESARQSLDRRQEVVIDVPNNTNPEQTAENGAQQKKKKHRLPKRFRAEDEDENYYPQYYKQPAIKKRKRTGCRAVRSYFKTDWPNFTAILFFILLNIGFFLWKFLVIYIQRNELVQTIGWSVPISRGFAHVLIIDTCLLLLMVCRNFLTALRSTWVKDIIPLDKNILFHRCIAYVIVGATVGHVYVSLANCNCTNFKCSVAHYITNAAVAQAPAEVVETVVPQYAGLEFWEITYTKIAGITGHILICVMIIMYVCAIRKYRAENFERFWYTHHLFIVFYALLIAHGTGAVLQPPEYYKWFVFFGTIYLVERIIRIVRAKQKVTLESATPLPAKVLRLQMSKPKDTWKYKSGQYIFLNSPDLSKFEWHPFTLTSCPEEPYISVHIRSLGNWTKKLYDYCTKEKKTPRLYVDGPFGSASEHVFDYEHVMLIGTGIGVTPFASILKHIRYRLENDTEHELKLKKVHFYWITREQDSFQWFGELLSDIQKQNASDFLEVNTFLTSAFNKNDLRSTLLHYGLEQEYDKQAKDIVTGLKSRTYWGRPKFDIIFNYMQELYPNEGKYSNSFN
jgi:predicted ferric reductase/Ca2+-binding EF-hand superfamily protein